MKHLDHDQLESMVADGLNIGAVECHEVAKEKGFHDDEARIWNVIEANAPLPANDGGIESEINNYLDARAWFKSTCEQAEIARMHSELSEWLETVRKNPGLADNHCPEFLSVEIEAADLIFRVLDTCGKRGYRIGDAFVAKWRYNKGRPFKHGKNS